MLLPLPSLTAMPPSSPFPKSKRPSHQNPSSTSSSFSSSGTAVACNHSPSATLDLLILVLVLFSCTFLITSSFSHIFRSLSQILPSLLRPLTASLRDSPAPYIAALLLLAASLAAAEISCHRACLWSRRRCGKPRCRGLKKAMEFDVQLQTGSPSPADATWQEIDGLPWKGGQQGNNPDYECLRAELRRMAPPNGRAVLLFRARCGCPIAKLEAWAPKRGRKPKKGMASLALEGGER